MKWQQVSPLGGAGTVRVIAFRKVGGISHEKVPDIICLLIFRLREFSLGRTDFCEARHWCQRADKTSQGWADENQPL